MDEDRIDSLLLSVQLVSGGKKGATIAERSNIDFNHIQSRFKGTYKGKF